MTRAGGAGGRFVLFERFQRITTNLPVSGNAAPGAPRAFRLGLNRRAAEIKLTALQKFAAFPIRIIANNS
jgi:hypothetical protein